MVKCNLSTLMGSKRMNIQDVCNDTKLARNTIANLYNDKAARVDYNTINQLCKALDCTVGDLFSYVEDDK